MNGHAHRVGLITVSYHSEAYLPALLQSATVASRTPLHPIVVNNAVENPSLDATAFSAFGVHFVDANENLGYGRAMNLGARHAEAADWLLLSNPDLTYSEGAIDELVRVGESDPAIGAVGPLILTPSGEIYPSARRLPSLRHGIGHAVLGQVWKSNPWTRAYLADRESPPRQREAGWLSGACILVRRSAFEAIGGFDDKFFMYFEDVDLGARLAAAGWRIVYAPSAVITHVGGHSTKSINRKMIEVHHESAYKYLAARYTAWYLAPLRFALLVGLRIRSRFARS